MADENSRRSTKRATLQDVAKQAGVSPITVSRAIRQPDKVSHKAREKVREAVAKLGYIPNLSASRLASARSYTVCAIIPSITNIVFADVMRAIDDVFSTTSYQVLIGNTRYSPLEEEKLVSKFLEHNPDGLILSGVDQTDICRKTLQAAGVPIVQIMDYDGQAIDMNVGLSHFQAGYDITRHLIDRGYKTIGFIGAQMDPRTQKRMKGHFQALKDAGLENVQGRSISHAPSSVKIGGELFDDLLSKQPDLDAVFCINDDLAMGAIFECQRRQIAVPDQVAIAGFNDLEPSRCINPALTTIRTPRYEMGQKAATLLVDCMNGASLSAEDSRINIGYELIVRAST